MISQSVLSGDLDPKKKTLSGNLTTNQKILSGNFTEKIVTSAKWGKITGDIYLQEDLIALLQQCSSVVTSIVENPDAEEVTINYIDENGIEQSKVFPESWVFDRLKYIYRNNQQQEVLAVLESTEYISRDGITISMPDLVIWVNDGSIDGRLIKLATLEGTGNALIALKSYIDSNFAQLNNLSPVATSGDIADLTQSDYFVIDCGTSTQVIGG